MSDDDYFVSNAVSYLIEDLEDDERYVLQSEAQKTAALVWMTDRLIRGNCIEGWIESLGQRPDDAVTALRALAATGSDRDLRSGAPALPDTARKHAEGRLAAVDAWSASEVQACRDLEDRFLEAINADDPIDGLRPALHSGAP